MTAVPAGHVPSEPDSFTESYVATVEKTLATARRIAGDREIARDATQDAYVVMVERWGERRMQSLRDNQRYVIGIAVNKIADRHRHDERLSPLGDECDPPVEDGYEQILDQLTLFKMVRHLLESQSVGTRAVGILYFLEQFEYSEIAEVLGITPSTVRTQVQRLRARLRPMVNRIAEPPEGGAQP
jgi:RNA polymerase sigma-70 factor (ECF subfamily)